MYQLTKTIQKKCYELVIDPAISLQLHLLSICLSVPYKGIRLITFPYFNVQSHKYIGLYLCISAEIYSKKSKKKLTSMIVVGRYQLSHCFQFFNDINFQIHYCSVVHPKSTFFCGLHWFQSICLNLTFYITMIFYNEEFHQAFFDGFVHHIMCFFFR